jgi:hypothetical protein
MAEPSQSDKQASPGLQTDTNVEDEDPGSFQQATGLHSSLDRVDYREGQPGPSGDTGSEKLETYDHPEGQAEQYEAIEIAPGDPAGHTGVRGFGGDTSGIVGYAPDKGDLPETLEAVDTQPGSLEELESFEVEGAGDWIVKAPGNEKMSDIPLKQGTDAADEVDIAFDSGDTAAPLQIGALYQDAVPPPQGQPETGLFALEPLEPASALTDDRTGHSVEPGSSLGASLPEEPPPLQEIAPPQPPPEPEAESTLAELSSEPQGFQFSLPPPDDGVPTDDGNDSDDLEDLLEV